MKGKVFEVSLFVIGIALSVITGLLTNDLNSSYENNKETTIILGGILIALGMIISVYKENSSKEDVGEDNKGIAPLFIHLIFGLILFAVIGLVLSSTISAVILDWYEESRSFLGEIGLKYILPVITCSIVGQRFRYITGTRTIGSILGAFLGLMLSFDKMVRKELLAYLNKLALQYLNQGSEGLVWADTINDAGGLLTGILLSTIGASLIGGFTSIYRERYKIQLAEESSKLDDLREMVRSKGQIIETSGFLSRAFRFERYLKSEEGRQKHKDESKTYLWIIKRLKESKDEFYEEPMALYVSKLLQKIFLVRPSTPFILIDADKSEIRRFETLNLLREYIISRVAQ